MVAGSLVERAQNPEDDLGHDDDGEEFLEPSRKGMLAGALLNGVYTAGKSRLKGEARKRLNHLMSSTLRRAMRLAKSTGDVGLVEAIGAYCMLHGIKLKSSSDELTRRLTEKVDEDGPGRDEGTKPNQHRWAQGKAEAELQKVLAGQATFNGNLQQIMRALSGSGWGEMSTTPTVSHAPAPLTPPPTIIPYGAAVKGGALWKSDPLGWQQKVEAVIDQKVTDGSWKLEDELSARDIISYCQAASRNLIPEQTLINRVRTLSPHVQDLFSDIPPVELAL